MIILGPEIQQFIRDHENEDERKLILAHKEILGIPSSIVAEQIAARRKAKEKLPTWYNTSNIIYPATVNLEQSSSEQTAAFKLEIIKEELPSKRIRAHDLTGGFGVDTFFLSKVFEKVDYVEPEAVLVEISRHNQHLLKANNIQYHHTTAEQYLHQLREKVDFIFIDPSRRSENKKVFSLSESAPDIVGLQPLISEKGDVMLLKASPLLDIKLGLRELSFVKKVYVVAVENEVKELLFLCVKDFGNEPVIEAVNLSNRKPAESFEFLFSDEGRLALSFSDPLSYLYEPYTAILKAGAFKTVAEKFQVKKIHPSTHLYTSEMLITHFPGRIFKIEDMVKPDPKMLQKHFPGSRANVITRNYPLSVEELRKKTGIKDGGEKYMIGFSGVKKKFVAVSTRIN